MAFQKPASNMNIEKTEQPKLAQHDSSVLDLAFVMDCTGSMGSYIENARNVSNFDFMYLRSYLRLNLSFAF